MKYFSFFCFVLFSIIACKKPLNTSKSNTKAIKNVPATTSVELRQKIVYDAKNWLGIPYKLGGTDGSGMDCSGLVYRVFQDNSISLPRTALNQSLKFESVPLEHAQKGDLVYFSTTGSKIDHTGILVEIKDSKNVLFIHSSSSKGVRIDNLFSTYWYPKLIKLTRPQI
ncbi:MAG: C40 family peptidase [Leadbetterella sp.]